VALPFPFFRRHLVAGKILVLHPEARHRHLQNANCPTRRSRRKVTRFEKIPRPDPASRFSKCSARVVENMGTKEGDIFEKRNLLMARDRMLVDEVIRSIRETEGECRALRSTPSPERYTAGPRRRG